MSSIYDGFSTWFQLCLRLVEDKHLSEEEKDFELLKDAVVRLAGNYSGEEWNDFNKIFWICVDKYNFTVKNNKECSVEVKEVEKAKDDENEMLKKQNKELKEQNEELWKLVKDAMNTILGLYNTFWWTKFEQLK